MARFRSKRRGKYKSRLELLFATLAFKHDLQFEYEADRIPFIRPAHYVPDWKIAERVYIETKGYLAPSDRAKLIAFKEQHQDITILLCFANAQNRLNSNSKTTYGEWATKNGFDWHDLREGLPVHWWQKHNSANQKSSKGRRRQFRSNPAA
jgi:hypothetical protein